MTLAEPRRVIERAQRHADDGMVPDHGAGMCRRQLILPDVHASGPESRATSERSSTMIVAPAAARARQSRSPHPGDASGKLLGPDLQQPGAAARHADAKSTSAQPAFAQTPRRRRRREEVAERSAFRFSPWTERSDRFGETAPGRRGEEAVHERRADLAGDELGVVQDAAGASGSWS